MKLIAEFSDFKDYRIIKEQKEEGGESNLYFEGPFLKADIWNKNKRRYPLSVLNPSVKTYITEMVDSSRALGELGHPDGVIINLERVSHIVRELKMNDTVGFGKAQVLTKTPFGKIAEALIEEKVMLGVSTRGLGAMTEVEEGKKHEVDEFHLIAIDLIADPSTPGAFVNGIREGKEYFLEGNGNISEVVDAYDNFERVLAQLPRREREKAVETAVKRFLDSVVGG